MVYKWLNSIQSYLYPDYCLVCLAHHHGPITHLCPACQEDLPRIEACCRQCGIPLPLSGNVLCGQCQKDPPHFDAAVIPFIYASPLDQLISRLKFSANMSMLPCLAQLWLDRYAAVPGQTPQCLIPVPLHPARLRQRGFNQSLELARILSRQLEIKLEAGLCRRSRATPPQSELDAKQRNRNVRGAFQVTTEHRYRHVAIMDDVVTTGSTASELAIRLKRSGVEKVEIWALARALK